MLLLTSEGSGKYGSADMISLLHKQSDFGYYSWLASLTATSRAASFIVYIDRPRLQTPSAIRSTATQEDPT